MLRASQAGGITFFQAFDEDKKENNGAGVDDKKRREVGSAIGKVGGETEKQNHQNFGQNAENFAFFSRHVNSLLIKVQALSPPLLGRR